MNIRFAHKSFILLLTIVMMLISSLCNISYANTYSNNSVEIEVSPERRSYDYGDNVGIDISITNKNRYAKLYYKITEVYSGGGFIPLNLDTNENVIDVLGSREIEVSLRDYFYHEREDRDISSGITFNNDASSRISVDNDTSSGMSKNNSYTSPQNSQVAGSGISKNSSYNSPNNSNKADSGISKKNGYYSKIRTYTIGGHAYEITEAEYDEFERYRNEKVVGHKIGTTPEERSEEEQLESIKGTINATFLIIIVILIIMIIFIIFIWFLVKSKERGGYPSLSQFQNPFRVLLITTLFTTLLLNIIKKNITYAADIYQENVIYNKSVRTQVNYANFTCTFEVRIEYYFINTIAPITDLELDTDSDTLPDYLEVLYLTDLNNDDTDGDGLPDGVEVYKTYTDPLRIDTDNNGTNDGEEDYDKDGLTNIEEKNNGTDYDNIDTDFDSLSDYDEVNGVKSKDGTKTYILNPLSDDTDGDGLRDDTEIKLGLNPTNPSDAHIKVYQEIATSSVLPKELTIESPTPISFRGELVGDIDENVSARLATDNYYDTIRGKIGLPIKVDTTYGGDGGLKIIFDLSKYKVKADRIKLFRYNSGNLTMVDRTYVSNNSLIGDVYSGEYVLIDTQVLLQDVNIFIS